MNLALSVDLYIFDLTIAGHYVLYESETGSGSSGSPIFKEHAEGLKVVGIHKAGDKEKMAFNMGTLLRSEQHEPGMIMWSFCD